MQPRPLGKMVIIKAADPQKVSEGGIYLPDNGKSKPTHGVLVAKSHGATGRLGGVLTGSTVMFSPHAGLNIEFNKTPHLIMHEEEVLAVIAGPKAK